MPHGVPALLSVPIEYRNRPVRGEVNTTNRIYESMYIVDSGLSDEQMESIVAKYTQLITDQGGTVQAAGRWDKRRLAYDVQGHGDGIFVLMFFEGTPEVAAELDRVFRISDDVFRHLITRVEPEHVDASRIGQPVAEEAAPEAPAAAPKEEAEAKEEPTAEAAEAAEEVVAEEAPVAEEVEAAAEETPAVEEAAAEETPAVDESEPEQAAEEAAPAEEPAAEAAEEAAEEPVAEQSEGAEEAAPESEKES
jgi:small subunit ribosomal protein S6